MHRAKRIAEFFIKHKYYLYAVTVVSLIVIHGRFDTYFKVDSLTLILLLFLFAIPYIPLIKTWKFKYGDLEAEITTGEVKEIERKVDKIPLNAEAVDNAKSLNLKELSKSDPQLALAKVRIETEKQLQLLISIYDPQNKNKNRFSLIRMLEYLEQQGVIERPLATALRDIMAVANRAIHGEDISAENATKLIDTASKALNELEFVIFNHAIKSATKEIVDQATVEMYSKAEYLLTTILPVVHNPEKVIYKVNQAELEAFLENYGEYGEFIVELRKLA